MSDFNPYEAPSAHVQDNPGGYQELADRGTRLVAVILDSLIAGAVAGILAAIAIPALLASRSGGGSAGNPIFAAVLGLLLLGWMVGLLIWNIRWVSLYGQTIGKRIMKIKMVRSDGSPLSAGRWFGLRVLPVTILGMIPLLGYLVSLTDALLIFRDNRKCLHDDIADTVVVKAD